VITFDLTVRRVAKTLSKIEAYRALANKSRLEILKLLYKKPRSIEEISNKMNLQPITVRHHLQSLMDAGFIESYEERVRTAGRPKVYYRIAKEPSLVSFPKRGYFTLSNLLINTLLFLFGANRANQILRRVGISMGKNAIKRLEYENDIKEWSLKAYEKFFIKGYLENEGTEPAIVEVSGNKIVYRLHNCLFFELALKMPEMICDVLHESFHEGVSDATGKKFKISRLTCMGKGDLYCEHICQIIK
jgi:predicted ArsR family transcriptional regulator